MRQLLTWRLVAALGALAVLALGVDAVFGDSGPQGSITAADPSNVDADGEIIERRIDLASLVSRFDGADTWAINSEGQTTGFLDVVLDETRVVRIAPGTPGESSCPDYAVANGCVIMVDLLGEAVVWFSLLPAGPRETVELPPIIELEDGFAIFKSGVQIRYEEVIQRDCSEDKNITSFSDFLRRFGPGSTTILDLETQRIARVLCGEETIPSQPATSEAPAISGEAGTPDSVVESGEPDS